MDQRGHEVDYALHYCCAVQGNARCPLWDLLFLQEVFSGFALFRIRAVVTVQPWRDVAIAGLQCSFFRLNPSAWYRYESNCLTGVASVSGHMKPSFGGRTVAEPLAAGTPVGSGDPDGGCGVRPDCGTKEGGGRGVAGEADPGGGIGDVPGGGKGKGGRNPGGLNLVSR